MDPKKIEALMGVLAATEAAGYVTVPWEVEGDDDVPVTFTLVDPERKIGVTLRVTEQLL